MLQLLKTYVWITSIKSQCSKLIHLPAGTIHAKVEVKANIKDCVHMRHLILKYLGAFMLRCLFSGHFKQQLLLKYELKWVHFWMLKRVYVWTGYNSKIC